VDGEVMTIHVLHAGDGYTYLTRQVASGDVARRRGEALTDYYTVEGNPPGRWVGSGRAAMGIDGSVTEAQMKALFGEGLHPDAEVRIRAAVASGKSIEGAEASVRLGRRFPVMDHTGEVWRERLDAAYRAFRGKNGRRPERGPERDLIRWNVANDLFRETHGRTPVDDAELKSFVAKVAKPARQPVAGVDLVFTPVKSVSVLWALGDEWVRQQVLEAHEAAWRCAFAYIEREAALTRTGAAGVAQVDTRGLVAAAFDHPDSRTGDPNLHTHVAVSAKVQGLDGKWRALDLRVLHAMAVSASETYNTAIEDELRARLGVRFVERPTGRDKRPVREIDGIPSALLTAFSSRRTQVESGYREALARYRDAHGHDAPRHVQYRLAQEATLANRPDKDRLRSWAHARREGLAQAREVLGRGPFGRGGDVEATIRAVLEQRVPAWHGEEPDLADLARQAVEAVAEARSTWTRWHIEAEVQRLTRPLAVPPEARDALVAEVTARALAGECLLLAAPDTNPEPAGLRRCDGESVYCVHGMARYTSERLILAVEDRLLAAAEEHTCVGTADPVLDAARAWLEASHGWLFDGAQVDLACSFVCDDRRLVVGVGPAGTGKTTAMQLTAAALAADGRRLVAVAPSAKAAAVLGKEIGVPATTLAKLLHAHHETPGATISGDLNLRAGDVVLVDEAGMAGTPALGRLLELSARSGALLRLLGDPMQLSAVEAGGALRLLAQESEAAELDRVHRFADPQEAQATLQLRRGLPSAVGFYEAHARLDEGGRQAMVEDVYDAWRQDVLAGRASLMVSASAREVADLSSRARIDRIAAGEVEPDGLVLHDGNRAGPGDVVVTRANRRLLTVHGRRDFVKNGDLWQVTERLPNGDLNVRSLNHAGRVRLPAAYAAAHVELGYATTVHRAQGMTVDTCHVLVDKSMCRESLYVAMSRGRLANRAYVVTDEALEVDLHVPPGPRLDGVTVLRSVLAREGSERSATETLRDTLESAESLATLVPRYVDALTRAAITAELEEAVRAGLRDAGGRALEQSAADAPGWLQLLLACAGEPPRERVAEAVRSRLMDAAEVQDVAAVLAWRVIRLGDDEGPGENGVGSNHDRARFRPPWLMPPPTGLAPDPVGVWAIHQDRLVTARVESLVEQLATNAPEWAHGIRPRPEPSSARDAWERDAALVVAYRDQHRLPDGAGPVGQRPPGARCDDGYAAVRAAWLRLLPEHPPVTAPAGSVNERLQALAPRPVPADRVSALQRSSRAGRTPSEPPPPRPAHTHQAPRW
jgi:conjugative relaxase-like TrwC/TraI family protein